MPVGSLRCAVRARRRDWYGEFLKRSCPPGEGRNQSDRAKRGTRRPLLRDRPDEENHRPPQPLQRITESTACPGTRSLPLTGQSSPTHSPSPPTRTNRDLPAANPGTAPSLPPPRQRLGHLHTLFHPLCQQRLCHGHARPSLPQGHTSDLRPGDSTDLGQTLNLPAQAVMALT